MDPIPDQTPLRGLIPICTKNNLHGINQCKGQHASAAFRHNEGDSQDASKQPMSKKGALQTVPSCWCTEQITPAVTRCLAVEKGTLQTVPNYLGTERIMPAIEQGRCFFLCCTQLVWEGSLESLLLDLLEWFVWCCWPIHKRSGSLHLEGRAKRALTLAGRYGI